VAPGKIFGIGLNKTGTRSLAVALRHLGYRTLHKGDARSRELVERAHREDQPLLRYLGSRFDAYLDVSPLVRLFPIADRQYPGSKFILTTRPMEAWLDSRERHVLANVERAARGEYDGPWISVDREAWRQERLAHDDAVRTYFADRPTDLLVMDIPAGDGWEKLAPFLGKPLPSHPFPWENRDGLGTYREEGRLDRTRRRVSYLVARFRG
jgi:hypothetical protein